MRIWPRILLSVLVHLALIGGVWWTLHTSPLPPGDGLVMEVSVIGGDAGANGETTALTPSVPPTAPQLDTHATTTPSSTTATSSSLPTPQGNGNGLGEGEGTGSQIETGSGAHGSGGNPTYATILSRIQRARYYPLIARRNGWVGEPEVAFSIGPDGRVVNAAVIRPATHTELNNAAIETLHRAEPLPYYPKQIRLRIRFELN